MNDYRSISGPSGRRRAPRPSPGEETAATTHWARTAQSGLPRSGIPRIPGSSKDRSNRGPAAIKYRLRQRACNSEPKETAGLASNAERPPSRGAGGAPRLRRPGTPRAARRPSQNAPRGAPTRSHPRVPCAAGSLPAGSARAAGAERALGWLPHPLGPCPVRGRGLKFPPGRPWARAMLLGRPRL